jgi:DIL domain
MFVFTESDLPALLDIVITKMLPQRSAAQKPIPANFIFLAARYAHYYQNDETLKILFEEVAIRIERVIQSHPDDMTIHAFWISNTLLLLHYLKKDPGLMAVSVDFQVKISDLLQESYFTLLRDAENRLGRVLDSAILDNETIQGLDELTFGDEWRLFRSRSHKSPKRSTRTPSPRRRADPSPRNVTSLLSSIQFILETYDIHPVIIAQCQAQVFYWLGTELFNRILAKKKYQSRSKAMQIRLNVSTLEDWLRINVKPLSEAHAGDSSAYVRRTASEIGREFLGPLVQLLQWLQVLSSLGDEEDTFRRTVDALDLLTPSQLLSATNNYRVEVGEHPMPKKFKEILRTMELEKEEARRKARTRLSSLPPSSPSTPTKPSSPTSNFAPMFEEDDFPPPSKLLLPSSTLLPFALPTATEMITSYGTGIGGIQKERYLPTLPPEFIEKLDNVNSNGTNVPLGGVSKRWVDEDVNEEREIAERIAVRGAVGWGQ